MFELRNAAFRYRDFEALRIDALEFSAGQFATIAGPNGAGKSTLLAVLSGLLTPSSGCCLFEGRAAHEWPRREFARKVAVVRQEESTAFPFTAEEVVAMGRMPHRTGVYETAADKAAIDAALAATGAAAFRRREFRTLSGGERQRVLLAGALAQEPEVLLLDEPATHLDIHHQLSLHQLLRDLSRRGVLVIAVTHDLNLAAAYADRLVILENGVVRADGRAAEVGGSDVVGKVFDVPVEVHWRESGRPWLIFGDAR